MSRPSQRLRVWSLWNVAAVRYSSAHCRLRHRPHPQMQHGGSQERSLHHCPIHLHTASRTRALPQAVCLQEHGHTCSSCSESSLFQHITHALPYLRDEVELAVEHSCGAGQAHLHAAIHPSSKHFRMSTPCASRHVPRREPPIALSPLHTVESHLKESEGLLKCNQKPRT